MPLSLPNVVSSYVSPSVLSFTPRFAWNSRKKSNITCVKWPSCGEVRKNHLKPRVVSAGDDDSALRNGTPWRSATWLATAVTLECQQPTSAATFSWVMRRSASAWPTSGLP